MIVFTESIGWIGSFLIVVAYYLVSNKKLDASHPAYQWLNLIGAGALGINVFYKHAWPAVALEVIWAAIAILALTRNQTAKN